MILKIWKFEMIPAWYKLHKEMYGHTDDRKIPVLGSDYNPLKLLGTINTREIKKVDTQIGLIEDKLWQLEHPGEELYATTGKLE